MAIQCDNIILPYKDETVRLDIRCPNGCPCKSEAIRSWPCQKCKILLRITENGDVFCICCKRSNFIQNQTFQCQKAAKQDTHHNFKNRSQFLDAINKGLDNEEVFLMTAQNKTKFYNNLSKNLLSKWN